MVRTLLFILMTLVLLGGTVAAFMWGERSREEELQRISAVRIAIERLEREVRVRAATDQADLNVRGWPKTIDPAWFESNPPVNGLVPTDRPWLEVASAQDEDLDHPTIRQSVTGRLATFWYNPGTGQIRARVGPSVSDRKALELYNAINGSAVPTLFDSEAERIAEELAGENPRYEELRSKEDDQPSGPMVVVRRRADPRVSEAGSDSSSNR